MSSTSSAPPSREPDHSREMFQYKSDLTEREMRLLLRRVVIRGGIPKEIYNQIVQDSLGHPQRSKF